VTRIVVLGDVMVDVVARLSGPVAVGSDSAAEIEWGFGGSAANVAAWLAVAGPQRPVLVGRVGDDPQGVATARELAERGVDTHLAVDPARATGTCIVLVAPGGERSMLPDAGANDGLAEADLPSSVLVGGGHLHVVGYALLREGSRPAARSAIERAKAAGMTVSVDPSSAALLSPEFLALAEGADLLLPNADEAEALGGVAALAERFPEVVVKLGADGAVWTDGRKEMRIRAAATPALDSTGAGDAFAAGLISARFNWAGTGEALASGRDLAARAIAKHGGRPPPPRAHHQPWNR
jgi:sugar/nucleoside kinase (ribokinase family)